MNSDWKEEALKYEKDPHIRKIIIDGPHGLSSFWCYRHLRQKYSKEQ